MTNRQSIDSLLGEIELESNHDKSKMSVNMILNDLIVDETKFKNSVDYLMSIYNKFNKMGKAIDYKKKIVIDFSDCSNITDTLINKFAKSISSDDYSGVYITALAEASDKVEHNIHLSKPSNYLCYKFDSYKTLNIFQDFNKTSNSNLGDYFGKKMIKGVINVNGNLGNHAFLKTIGGKIIVNGSIGNEACFETVGGDYIFNGSVGELFGMELKGGNYVLKKTVGDGALYYMKGGNVSFYQKPNSSFGESKKGGKITIK